MKKRVSPKRLEKDNFKLRRDLHDTNDRLNHKTKLIEDYKAMQLKTEELIRVCANHWLTPHESKMLAESWLKFSWSQHVDYLVSVANRHRIVMNLAEKK